MKKKILTDKKYDLESLQNMRIKIDVLRVENQYLRFELEQLYSELNLFLSVRYLLKKASKLFWHKCQKKIERLLKTFINIFFNSNKNENNLEKSFYSENFTPYKITIINPIQNNRPRILHIIGNFYTGGSSQLIVDLIEHLGHRFEQEVIARDLPSKPSYVGLKIHHYEQLNHYHQALDLLNNFRPDFIHLHYLGHHEDDYSELDWKWYHKFFLAAREYGCKIVENINIPTDPYVSDLVSHYVYVSDYVKQEFGHLSDRNITIYPGSDLKLFSRDNNSELPSDCIGMVYRLEGDKLDENAIDVFIKVIQRRPRTKALIVGGGYYLELYQNKVQQAGVEEAFTFTGYTSYENLPQLYEQISLFVAPVHTESFGQVTPFAMGMGIPVVGYKVGAIPEIVEDCDLLAPPEDSDALAEIIIDLLGDRQRQHEIGAKNIQRARQRFSLEAMIDSYGQIYEQILATLEKTI